MVCAGIVARAPKSIQVLPPISWQWLLWAGWAALSIAWSVEPERSLKEWQNEILYTTLALLVCHIGAQARGAARAFVPVLAVAAALACVSSIWAYLSGFELDPQAGWHGGPGDHSAALLVLMPCVLAHFWYATRSGRSRAALAGIGVLIVLLLGSAYATQNRTVWLGFALEIAAFALVLAARRAGEPRAQLAIALAGAVLVAATAAMTLRVQVQRETIGAHSMNADPRLSIWPKASQYIESRPLGGYGFGRGLLRDRLPEEAHHELAWHAHNLFLDLALQVGFTGVLLFVLVLAAILRAALRYAADASAASAACGLALIGVLTGMLTRNMTDVLLVRQNSLLFWGLTGVLLAWGARWRAGAKRPAP